VVNTIFLDYMLCILGSSMLWINKASPFCVDADRKNAVTFVRNLTVLTCSADNNF